MQPVCFMAAEGRAGQDFSACLMEGLCSEPWVKLQCNSCTSGPTVMFNGCERGVKSYLRPHIFCWCSDSLQEMLGIWAGDLEKGCTLSPGKTEQGML